VPCAPVQSNKDVLKFKLLGVQFLKYRTQLFCCNYVVIRIRSNPDFFAVSGIFAGSEYDATKILNTYIAFIIISSAENLHLI
jgi:hypothetical protein